MIVLLCSFCLSDSNCAGVSDCTALISLVLWRSTDSIFFSFPKSLLDSTGICGLVELWTLLILCTISLSLSCVIESFDSSEHPSSYCSFFEALGFFSRTGRERTTSERPIDIIFNSHAWMSFLKLVIKVWLDRNMNNTLTNIFYLKWKLFIFDVDRVVNIKYNMVG